MPSIQQQNARRWEKYIRRECEELLRRGEADVDKNWEAPTVPGTHVPREKSKPDFSGFLNNGRHVVFEAKATMSTTSFSFSDIADHQEATLRRAFRWNAISFVYVLDGHQRRWVLPWYTIRCCRVGRESFPFNDETPARKREGETWLETWKRLEQEGMTRERCK